MLLSNYAIIVGPDISLVQIIEVPSAYDDVFPVVILELIIGFSVLIIA